MICLFSVVFGLPQCKRLWEKKNYILHLSFSKLNSLNQEAASQRVFMQFQESSQKFSLEEPHKQM